MCQHPQLCPVLVAIRITSIKTNEQHALGPIIVYLSIPWLKPYLGPFVYPSCMNPFFFIWGPHESTNCTMRNHGTNPQTFFPEFTGKPNIFGHCHIYIYIYMYILMYILMYIYIDEAGCVKLVYTYV